ncbi:uncharacterized protein si:ch211-288g17.4 [Myxocyprinus asiaticus]|uniref:uncharacterized protein si:ch211-288g17.4 n=1 Tax=Myxocyprinus asiaticus TaxID=70543 RepID=UPI002222AB81|nr:uncharacterized protein si:ch211-288g17.4 [Myxocyprinus asiaticus]
MKSLAFLILAVVLSKGVDSVTLTDKDYEIADKLLTFGAEAFLKFLDNLKIAAETAVKNNEINKTGNEMQDFWNSLKELIERIIAEERAKGNQDELLLATKIFHRLGKLYLNGLFSLIDTFPSEHFFGSVNIFQGVLKNETIVEIWKDMESRYFPGAPPIYSDPMGFLSYLLSRMVEPQMNRILKVASEVGKIDIDQLYEDAQMAINLVREKAMEISTLEMQKEKNDFLITLRTAFGVLTFYWENLLEYTESWAFHNKYLAALRRWKELAVLKNTSENYHVIIDPETGRQALIWADQHFGSYFGNEKFNQSSWAILKIATVYPLPIYEKLSESGLGISEINSCLINANDILTELLGEEILHNFRGVLNEQWNTFNNEILQLSINKQNKFTSDGEGEDQLRHLHKIKEILFDIWDQVLSTINTNMNEDDIEQSARYLDEVKTVFIKELIDSGEITQEKLDEAHKTLINVTHTLFEKYVKMIDGLDERISVSIQTLGKVMLKTFSTTNTVLINTLGFLLSD